MRANNQLLRELTLTQNLDSINLSLDEAMLAKAHFVDFGADVKNHLEVTDVYTRDIDTKETPKSALREPSSKRGLPALKPKTTCLSG
jgi:hypothetical protein